MPKKNRRVVQQTVLIVGEGACDEAFLKHLKTLYVNRMSGVRVKIINAQGGSPFDIVTFAARQIQNASFNRAYVVMDTDIRWLQKTVNKANRHKIRLIGTKPCIEGLMLNILGRKVPDSNDECKRQIRQVVKGEFTDKRSYQEHFSKYLLDESRNSIPALEEIINSYLKQK